MRLRSRGEQRVDVPALDLTVDFAAGEEMRTEVSAKFRERKVARRAGRRRAAAGALVDRPSRATSRCRWRSPERAAARFPGPPGKPAHPCRLNAGGVPVSLGPLGIWHPSQPAVLVGDPDRLGAVGGAGLADRGGQVVAHGALGEEQPAGDRGHRRRRRGRPAARRSRARSAATRRRPGCRRPATGSTTRSPACTRRTASASCARRGVLDDEPVGAGLQRPAQEARAGRTWSRSAPGSSGSAARSAAASPRCRPCPGISTSSRATSGAVLAARRPRPRRRCRPRRPPPGRARGRAARPARRGPGPGRRRAAAGCVIGRAHRAARSPRGSRRAGRPARRPAAAARSRRPARPWPGRAVGAPGPAPSSRTSTAVGAEPHRAAGGAAVPDHVGDALADRPGEQLAQLARARRRWSCGRSASISAAAQRRPRPGQLAGQGQLAVALHRPAHVGQRVAAEPLEVGELGAGPVRVDVEQPVGELGLDRDHGQRVAEDVVQVAGEPVALVRRPRAGRSPPGPASRSRLRGISWLHAPHRERRRADREGEAGRAATSPAPRDRRPRRRRPAPAVNATAVRVGRHITATTAT